MIITESFLHNFTKFHENSIEIEKKHIGIPRFEYELK